MDAQKAIMNYINKMTAVSGLKVMLMDKDTTAITSAVTTQTHLLQNEIFLVAKLEPQLLQVNNGNQQSHEPNNNLKHMKAIVFIRPTADAIQALCEELRRPQFAEYHLHFSNIVKKSQIERVAECDGMELVRSVFEYYGDYLALAPDLVTVDQSSQMSQQQYKIYGESAQQWDAQSLTRTVEALISLLLSLKKRPLIRYERNSLLCKRLGNELHSQITQEQQLFDFRRGDSTPVVFLLDRKNDPVTPLVMPWTYQAMVHELLTISNGRVSLEQVPDIRAELKQVVLSAQNDQFFKKNMNCNLGDLSENIKTYVNEYQAKSHGTAKIESISDMKRFVEDYPQFRQMSGNVSMHVAIVGELSRLVTRDGLLEVGELEQSLATSDSHALDFKQLCDVLAKDSVPAECKLRLVMLYALRYESSPSNQLPTLVDLLRRYGVQDQRIALIQQLQRFAGQQERLSEYSSQDFISKSKSVIIKGLKGVENVYEQHRPQLSVLLESLAKQRVRDQLYPFVDGSSRDRTQEVIIFMVGGVTFTEAKLVEQFNTATANVNGGVRVILSGNQVINSRQFLNGVQEASSRWSQQR